MEPNEILEALEVLEGPHVTVSEDRVAVYVPAIDDTVQVLASDVRQAHRIFAPNGDPAVELAVGDEAVQWPLIITGDDVVFAPLSPDDLLDSPISIAISNAPHLVAYSEIQRDAEALARDCDRPYIDLDGASGSLLLLRCFIGAGAMFGLRPLRAVAWWLRAWEALEGDVWLRFLPDAIWEGLAAEAAEVVLAPSTRQEPEDAQSLLAGLMTAEFDAVEPAMTAVQLDDEFVESWRRWIHVTPATFAKTLMEGLPTVRSDVALYPDGGGTIDLRDMEGDTVRALLQLRFSFPDGVMTIDEIRIREQARGRGLFQRLHFNTCRLAALVGLREIRLYATGVGSYALARIGVYPHDHDLFQRTTELYKRTTGHEFGSRAERLGDELSS